MLPDQESFDAFSRALKRRGFRKLSGGEFRSDFRRLALRAPRMREGREAGFVFMANGLKVQVWTTYLDTEGYAREQDAGWVLIKQGDKIRYSSHPHYRTRHFLYNLLLSAAIAKERVMNRPLCPKCSAYMDIAYGQALKARYWKCCRREEHDDGKPVNLDWDHGLPPIVVEFAEKIRKERARYRKQLRRQGRRPGAAMRRRIGWEVGNPQNVIPAR